MYPISYIGKMMKHSIEKRMINSSFYPWIIWLLSSLFMFYKYALEVSPSVMTKHLMTAFQIDATKLGNLAACYFYSYMIMQIPAGILIDKFGPRKTTTLAIILCSVGGLLFAGAHTATIAEIGRLLMGTGAAFAALNCLKLISSWFPSSKFALMAGLMMTLGMMGAVGGQAPLSSFIESLGWRQALTVISFAGFSLAALFFLFVRDGKTFYSCAPLNPRSTTLGEILKAVFKNRQGWWLSIYSGLAFAPVSVFGGLWGVPFLSQYYNISHTNAAKYVSLIFIGFAIGAPLFGWFSDLIGKRKNVMVMGTSIAFALSVILLASPPMPEIILAVVMLSLGFFISSFLLCFSMIREINPPIFAATAVGFMNSFDALIGALSDPLTGMILDKGWKGAMENGARIFPIEAYKIALTLLPLFLLLSLATLYWIKDTFCKSTYHDPLP
jgi:MFS family permease